MENSKTFTTDVTNSELNYIGISIACIGIGGLTTMYRLSEYQVICLSVHL